jgi:ankyrin repeat protein
MPSFSISQLSQAITSEQWDHAILLVEGSSKGMAKQFSNRPGFFEGIKLSSVLPIHEACANPDAPFAVIQAIVAAYPDGVKVCESAYQRLPLHIACRKHANQQIVKHLLDCYVHGSLIPDTLGRLPLHYALSNGAEDNIIDLLIEQSPNSARGTDRRGWLPLHVACSVGASTHVIEVILKAYPAASIIRTHKGTSVEKCMDGQSAMNKPEIYQLLAHHRAQVHDELGRPARRPSEGRAVV